MNRAVLRKGDLERHQKNAVWRGIQEPAETTLLGHRIGAGKTFEMVALANGTASAGLAKKPLIAVPNHLVSQFGRDFLQLYPNANVFIATKEHFAKGKREEAMARIATENYNAVIVSHKSFEFLPVSDDTFNEFLRKQIHTLRTPFLRRRETTRIPASSSSLRRQKSALKARSGTRPSARPRTRP